MKIGILNMQYSNWNYGAVLMPAAMEYLLKKLGHEVEHIDLRQNVAKFSFLDKIKILIKKILAIIGIRNYVSMYTNVFEIFRKKYLHRTKKIFYTLESLKKYKFQYDVVIVGSDQVWRTSFGGLFLYSYFLDFIPDNIKKISYAASFGFDYWELDKNDKRTLKIKELLDKFYSVSVREDIGVDICKEIFGINAIHVLDPVLLTERKYFEEITDNDVCENNEIVYYKVNNQSKIVSFITLCNFISEEMGIPNRNISYKEKHINKYNYIEYMEVLEWVKNIKKSNFVITDSFHCVCLAIIFEKQFLAWDLIQGGSSRLISILRSLELSERFINESYKKDTIKSLIEKKIDYMSVNKKLSLLREISYKFLMTALD